MVNNLPRYNHPMHLDDTIVAIATPPGRGGIGVVRLAGAEARDIARPMCDWRTDTTSSQAVLISAN